MPAQLLTLTGGNSILLDKPILLLGRHPECDIQLDSRKISRRHCCIAQVHEYLVVRDLGSTNGIRINGVRVIEGKLRAGDELTIGNFRYQVSWDAFAGAVMPRQPKVEALLPSAAAGPGDDDVLESCEDPVPLPEDGKPAGPVAAPAARDPRPDVSVGEDSSSDPHPGRPAKKDDSAISFILPENLELAPASDEIPRYRSPNGTSQ